MRDSLDPELVNLHLNFAWSFSKLEVMVSTADALSSFCTACPVTCTSPYIHFSNQEKLMTDIVFVCYYSAPFGIFDPNFDYISKSFAGMMKDLQKDPDSGLIGYTPYMNTRRESGNTIGGIYYFTSTEACLKWVKRGLHQRFVTSDCLRSFR